MTNKKNKLRFSILANLFSLVLVIGSVMVAGSTGPYWNIGPNDELVIISVHVDTIEKYIGFLVVITIINIMQIISEEIAMPIIGFNIYNPDKKVITDFGKNELQFYGNTMFMISAIRGIFMTMFIISQVDIAIWSVLIKEITSFFTIRLLLNEKEFVKESNINDSESSELTEIVINE